MLTDFAGALLVTVTGGTGSTASNGAVQLCYLDDVVSSLCASAGRSLTRAEWALYIQGPAYQNLCA